MNDILPLSKAATSVRPGIYRHFKGDLYEVLAVGRLSEARDQELVVYRGLELGWVWLRPVAMFLEEVARDGYKGPRFVWVRPSSGASLATAQKRVAQIVVDNGWSDAPTIDKFDHLHEELVEMSKLLRYKNPDERAIAVREHHEEFADGIGDLFFGLCRLANQLDVDIDRAFDATTTEFLRKYRGKVSEAKPLVN